jgi:hypothetical protein
MEGFEADMDGLLADLGRQVGMEAVEWNNGMPAF